MVQPLPAFDRNFIKNFVIFLIFCDFFYLLWGGRAAWWLSSFQSWPCSAMVNLTRTARLGVSPALNKKAEDLLTGRRYGRKGIQDKDVPYIERLPLSLKNLVSNTSTKGGEKACMDQMMSVIECLGKFDQNQSMCTKEINAFQTCYSKFQVDYEKKRAFRWENKTYIFWSYL